MTRREIFVLPVVVLVALVVYAAVSGDLLAKPSLAPHFVYLADALLHRQTAIDPQTFTGYDMILYNGQQYVAQQPMPALLLPVVALAPEIGAVSDVVFGVILAAVGVGLCTLMLSVVAPTLDTLRWLVLVAFFGFGTAYFSLSVLGTVWFLGQITAVVFSLGYIIAVWRRQWFLAGVMLACVALSRPSITPGALLFGAVWWWFDRPRQPQTVMKFAFPLVIGLVVLGGYNAARFGSPFDFGYSYLNDAPTIQERRVQYGSFSLAFLPENLYVATVKPPTINPDCLGTVDDCAAFAPDPWGMGLLWTSPLLLLAIISLARRDYPRWQRWGLGVAVVVVLLPSLLYHNTGSAQFGYRFILDALPFLMVLLAWAAERLPVWGMLALTVLCVVVNAFGARWLINLIVFNRV